MRRVSWLFYSVISVVLFLVVSGAIARSDWSPASADRRTGSTTGTAFTYQGYLSDGGAPADGSYDFVFKLYDDVSSGAQVGPAVDVNGHLVDNGQFTVKLDFEPGSEAVFDGTALWLEISVRPDADDQAPYSTLSPRQPLSPAPYAIYASRAEWDGLMGVPAGFADGIDDDTLYFAGMGLVLSDTTFAISTTYRLPQSCNEDQMVAWNGSGWLCADPAAGAAGWSLAGNAGTTPGSDFLGTTDDQALELRVNGRQALVLEPDAASPNFIAGYRDNSVGAIASGATIGGGGRDLATNQAIGDYSTVDGGAGNIAAGYASAVGGGEGNTAGDSYATIGGGSSNVASGNFASIGGGQSNTAGAVGVTVSGGQDNVATAPYGTISGGAMNSATGIYGVAGGGLNNDVAGAYGTVGGGGPSDLGNPESSNNQVLDDYGTVSGGGGNSAGSDDGDSTSAAGATVAGGQDNSASAAYATTGGGYANMTSGYGATIGGGAGNNAGSNYAAIAGGTANSAAGVNAAVGGGRSNSASQRSAAIAGGETNGASGAFSSVGGGYGNQAVALYGTIPGGANNHVGGNYGFAAGYQAQAEHQGAFVWSDSTPEAFFSTGPDQFLIQAAGGVGIGTNAPVEPLTVGGNAALLSDGRLTIRGVYTNTDPKLQKPSAIDSAGSAIYVTSRATNTLTIVDVSDPDNPMPVGYTTSGLHGPLDVHVAGGLAFIASETNNSLVIIDVSDPSQAESVGSSDRLLAKPRAVHVVGNRAYVASYGEDYTGLNDGLAIFDVSDPAEPLNRGLSDTYLEGTSDVYVTGDYAYVTSQKNDRLVVFDITDADNIVARGYASDALDAPGTVRVRGSYAYVLGSSSHNLVVFDIRDPDNIAYVGQATTALHQPTSLYLSGDVAYVTFAGDPGTNVNSGLAVFDVSDPFDIQTLSVIDMSASQPFAEKPVAIAGNGRHVYVANEAHHSVTIYDINHLTAPALAAGTVQAGELESTGDTRVNGNLSVGDGLNVGPGGALIEGQLSVAGRDDSYILGRLSLGAAGIVYSDSEKTQVMYPAQQLDVHGDARVRVNDNHSLIMASPPTKGAFFDFTSNDFGAYYTPTARIEFFVPDPFTGTTHTTDVKILTQSASDTQVRGRMTIGEEIIFHNVGPDLQLRTTISLTRNGDVLPGVDNSYQLGDGDHRWLAVYAANGAIQTSDGRLKENVSDLEAGLAEIDRLRPVRFNWIDNPEDGQHYGLIAQDVAEVLPEIVDGLGLSDRPLGMNYAELVPVLISAVQEQQAQVESQSAEITALKARLSALEDEPGRPDAEQKVAFSLSSPWFGILVALVVVGAAGQRRSIGRS